MSPFCGVVLTWSLAGFFCCYLRILTSNLFVHAYVLTGCLFLVAHQCVLHLTLRYRGLCFHLALASGWADQTCHRSWIQQEEHVCCTAVRLLKIPLVPVGQARHSLKIPRVIQELVICFELSATFQLLSWQRTRSIVHETSQKCQTRKSRAIRGWIQTEQSLVYLWRVCHRVLLGRLFRVVL